MHQDYPSSDIGAIEISKQGNCDTPRVGDSSAVPQPRKDAKNHKQVGERIRKVRVARGMMQTELAAAIGVKPHTMWRYEAGENMPNTKKMDGIAEALGVPQRYLVRGGPVPPGLDLDDDGKPKRKAIVPDPPITQDQQVALLDELDASPALRVCWGLHRQGVGAYQRITRVYMTRFLEVAQIEIDAGANVEAAADRAGEYAFNSAVEAHKLATAAAMPSKKARR